jgi:hypothetical protein
MTIMYIIVYKYSTLDMIMCIDDIEIYIGIENGENSYTY